MDSFYVYDTYELAEGKRGMGKIPNKNALKHK